MTRLQRLLRSAGNRQGMILGLAMVMAGGFDYAVNVIAGRWLEPVQYGIFISVTAIVQVLLLLSIAIRTVVALYTAELAAEQNPAGIVGSFVRQAWRWSWFWGLAGTTLLVVVGPTLASWLRLPNVWPVWAASLMVLMLFLRETSYGALQGTLSFTGLGVVQVVQAIMRILFAVGLILLGGRAAGAILAQPLSVGVGLCLAIWWLRPVFRSPETKVDRKVCWRYSANTLLGLAAFGMLANMDAVFVKRFFSPEIAGNYGPVVTLSKICLFLPWAIGIVLFPKVAQAQATGRDPRPILWKALAAAMIPGLGLTALYFSFPQQLVHTIFANGYSNPGMVLGMASLAATLYAGLNIWLNYALSLKRPGFIYSLLLLVVLQAAGMWTYGHTKVIRMTLVMVGIGMIGNLAGLVTTWTTFPAAQTRPVEPMESLEPVEIKVVRTGT